MNALKQNLNYDEGLAIAFKFHEAYERLAPSFGYETRLDTKAFDPDSANGRLMIAVCSEVTAELHADRDRLLTERALLSLHADHLTAACGVKDAALREAQVELERWDDWRGEGAVNIDSIVLSALSAALSAPSPISALLERLRAAEQKLTSAHRDNDYLAGCLASAVKAYGKTALDHETIP